MSKVKYNKLIGKEQSLKMWENLGPGYQHQWRSGKTLGRCLSVIAAALQNPDVKLSLFDHPDGLPKSRCGNRHLAALVEERIKDLGLLFLTVEVPANGDPATIIYEPYGDLEV